MMFEKYHGLLSKSPIGSVPCLIPETRAAMRYLPPPITHHSVIDVGSGQGSWTRELREKGYTVTPIDLDNTQFPGSFIVDMHDLSAFADSSFDIVFCTGTFEHAFAPFIVLSEFKRVTRNGGIILITLPMEDNIKMLEDAGHYCAVSRLQMEHQYCTKLKLTLEQYEKGQWDEVVGPHQIFILKVNK